MHPSSEAKLIKLSANITKPHGSTTPNDEVIAANTSCPRTEDGNPTRRAKIHYLLGRRNLSVNVLDEFVEQDIQNIIELFNVFNSGTHGAAGRFNLADPSGNQ